MDQRKLVDSLISTRSNYSDQEDWDSLLHRPKDDARGNRISRWHWPTRSCSLDGNHSTWRSQKIHRLIKQHNTILLNLVWVGRYLGIPGSILIIGSLVYSLRKRKYITSGTPRSLLTIHEFMAWLGSLLVLKWYFGRLYFWSLINPIPFSISFWIFE